MEESSDKEDSTDTSDLGWRSDLVSALSKQTDIVRLREICRGHDIPGECRANVWQVCLSVNDKPSPLQQWDEKLDTPDQQIIKKDCQACAGKVSLDDNDSVAEDMEKIITFYCKTRNERYKLQNGWVEMLLPLMSLGLPIGVVYNLFYAMHSKYIPRECHDEGKPFHLFRLLVQYHDPELCSFLDSMKLFPDQYAQKWFRSLFAATCDASVVEAMWDVYLLEEDPFLVFFLALVMIINAREDITTPGQEKSDILDVILEFPSQLAADDIEDFCSLAQYYSSKTPQSFRKQYYGQLFGVKTLNAHNVSQALCLPVSTDELLQSRKSQNDIRYFVVDCRPSEQYNSGHLPTAFHLDADLMLQAPSDFSTTVQALFSTQRQSVAADAAAGGEHLCFMGSGREEEDQYVNMVVANFLQKKTKYISLAKGGYKVLHDMLVDDLENGLTDHVPSSCIACSPHASTLQNEIRRNMSSKGDHSPGASLVGMLSSAIRTSKTNVTQKFSTWMSEPRDHEVKHVSSNDKMGKRYRETKFMFSIEDDDDEADDFKEASSDDEMKHETVNIKTWLKRKDIIQVIASKEVSMKTGRTYESHILVTDSFLFVLREMTSREGWATIRSRDHLKHIIKITSKKKRPEVITFTISPGESDDCSRRVRFIIPNAQKQIHKLKEFLIKSFGGE